MKKNYKEIDKSAVYRTHSLSKITAPNKPVAEPKASKIAKGGDMRSTKA